MDDYQEKIFEQINIKISQLKLKINNLKKIINKQSLKSTNDTTKIMVNFKILEDLNHILHVGNNLICSIYKEIGIFVE